MKTPTTTSASSSDKSTADKKAAAVTPEEVKDRVAVKHGYQDWQHLNFTHFNNYFDGLNVGQKAKVRKEYMVYENEAMQEYAEVYLKSKHISEYDWYFIANNDLPHEEGRYLVEDKFGRRCVCLYANSGATSENISFFSGICESDNKIIHSKDIIKWKNI